MLHRARVTRTHPACTYWAISALLSLKDIVLALQLSMKIYLNLHSAPYLYIQCESNKHPTNSGRDVLRSLNEESKKKQRVTVIQSCGDRVAIKCSGIIKTNGIRQLRPQLIYWVVSDTCFMSIHSCYMFDENRELSDLRLIVTSLCNSRQVMHRIEACNPEVNSYSR